MNPHEIIVGKVTCAFLSERFNTFTTIVPRVVHLRGYLVDLHPFGGVGRQKRLFGRDPRPGQGIIVPTET